MRDSRLLQAMNTEVDMCDFPIRWVYDDKSKVLPEEVIFYLFEEFLVDPQSISCLQRTCRGTRLWKYTLLYKFKLDWVYDNVKKIMGTEKTKHLRDGSWTIFHLNNYNIGAEGVKAVAEALKVNTTLTCIELAYNKIDDGRAKAIAEALKVNTSLTEIYLGENKIGDKGAKAIAAALKVNTSLTSTIYLYFNNIGDEGKAALREAKQVTSATLYY